jgi:TRAP-type uncharacterized transport system fused permease subunit
MPSFLIPIAFVRDPAILFVGDWPAIVAAAVTIASGSAAWTVMISGYISAPLNVVERMLFGAVAVVLILAPFGEIGRYVSLGAFALLIAWTLRSDSARGSAARSG